MEMRTRRTRDADQAYDPSGAAPARRSGVGPARAVTTVVAAGAAGLLVWLATQVGQGSNGDYWAAYGLIAAAGLVMALSQLLGGWTKWGVPHVSGSVFVLAFVPTLVVAGWVVAAGQPDPSWLRDHVLAWSSDIHVRGLVSDLRQYAPVLAFGIGLVLGYSLDTSGPRRVQGLERRVLADRPAADEPTTAERRETVVDRGPTTADGVDGDAAPARPRRGFPSRR
jgi:hypothetical protein